MIPRLTINLPIDFFSYQKHFSILFRDASVTIQVKQGCVSGLSGLK
ncbi:MAG: hypothetical protein JW915_00440 [Chitinispirillaceae bacterium]|nr:hypothetical protein [Chitinispirillaceae bacterium]